MAELLTEAELYRLTGSKDPEGQKEVLRKSGVPFVLRRDRKPALTWAMVNQSQLARAQSTTVTPQPNFSAING